MTTSLQARDITLSYSDTPIVSGLTLEVPDDSFTIIIGPNACGKSTLLRGFARLLRPSTGTVLLDGAELRSLKPKDAAKKLGLLPQSSIAPDGITVADLVGRGRFPHQSAMRTWSSADERAVAEAMAATGVTDLSRRLVDELSGGQRQRVWVAMALAQQTRHLLLDEPTTFLDIAHQIDLMELFADLHRNGTTLVAVLHDLNHAARYATHLVAMRDGEIVAQGDPREIITAELVEAVYDLPCTVITDPVSGTPLVLPLGRRTR
ncbi:ABC transporter ATP-binding protein [Microbacterium foliorum]|uniref:Putative siderophore transport system ATP-binding protein YusV n=1 Tax=Microbacterium foliorum TaxID=104336 RepID=A0A0F0KQJ1_9MICO|nr:ABC transporter ATP-binding protein [Microbacterium foliorum]AXL13041.1 ABC transporter ATP-binding protein [Microbacterium foliorum]KJL22390.1 putative siderophore transport system ATP-binding protein YusV [Microbacterium foliorum]